MSFRASLSQELQAIQGWAGQTPRTVTLTSPAGVTLAIDFVAVDSMSCAFNQLELSVPALQTAAFDKLSAWAVALGKRITYLLEQLAPLEFDPAAGQVLIRSTAPDKLPTGVQYYEIMLAKQGTGSFVLKRFRLVSGVPGRDQVALQTTHEVLLKLCDDLLDTAPSP